MSIGRTLQIRSSPHVHGEASVDRIMFDVVVALLPVCAFSVYTFGLASLLILSVAVTACLLSEYLLCRSAGRASTIGDWSAGVTGLLYGLTLPPALPLWMVAIGGFLAVAVGKFLFGGLGRNPFNPALVGRALLQAAFPVAMTTWPNSPSSRFTTLPQSTLAFPFSEPVYDALSGATPLANWKFQRIAAETGELFFGSVGGSTGETSSLLILLGGGYLLVRGAMGWRIPAAVLATVAAASGVLHWLDGDRYASPWFMLFSGGLMLGAVFMATDPVGSPMTHTGGVVYGVLIGFLVVVIRAWGGLPEGVMYAILLANAVSPHIDNWIRPRAYGANAGRPSHE